MSPYPDNPGPLPAAKLCNVSPPNPVTGDGALGDKNKGKMHYRGSDKEDLVKTLQQMLVALGYSVGEAGIDGKFGDGTEGGVKAFQAENADWEGTALKDDGLVGPRTSDALNRKMVGVWYDLYQTPVELTGGKLLYTATNDAFKAGLSIEPAGQAAAKVVVLDYKPPKLEPKIKIAMNDFLVLTPKKIGMEGMFEPSDKLVVERNGEEHKFGRKGGEVFIRPNVLVVGEFCVDDNSELVPEGDGFLWVVDSAGEPKCDEIPCRVLSTAARRPSAVIQMSDKEPKFRVAIIANPGIQETGKTGDDGPFTRDEIFKHRPEFHTRVIRILESLFDSAEDALRDEGIEPYVRFFTLFDDSMPADAQYSLLRKTANFNTDSIVGPRSIDLPDLLNNVLKGENEKADIVIAVSRLNFRCSAWFSTDDTAGTEYALDDHKYKYGTDTKSPGSFGDTVYLLPDKRKYDKLTPIHEFLHAMSEKDRGRITDLYNDDYYSGDNNVNKRKKSGANIPADFGKLDSTAYKSDAPGGSYKGRGGLGYPGADAINTTYGPELVDNSSCNVMDNFTRDTIDWKKCRLDRLTHQYVTDRLKAKIKNRT